MRFLTRKDGREYFHDDKFIFVKEGNEVFKLAVFDKNFYKLRLFKGVPVLEIDGLRMNLVKEFKSPLDYPREIAKLLFKTKTGNRKCKFGSCLDTCTGLGYTAIEASRHARNVVTCEINQAVLSLAQWNPWSADLFENNQTEVIQGDISSEIKEMKSNCFDAVIHDPPRFSKAGNLYSLEFYPDLFRVMKKGARLFHYVGSVGKGKRRRIHDEVAKRLKKAGFRNVRFVKRLQGLVCNK